MRRGREGGSVAGSDNRVESMDPVLLWKLRGAGIGSSIGHGCTYVVLPIYLIQRFGAGTTAMAMAFLGIAMSFSFFAGGVLADRAPRVPMMISADLLRAAATVSYLVSAAWIGSAGAIAIIAVATLMNGIAVGMFRPAEASLWPDIVPRHKLKATLATTSTLNRMGLIAGSSIGGLFVATHLTPVGVALDAATFVASGVILSMCRDPSRRGSDTPARATLRAALVAWKVWQSLPAMYRLAGRYGWLRRLLIGTNAFSLAQAASLVVLPVFIMAKFGSSTMAIYQTIPSFCLVAGSLCARHMSFKFPGVLYASGPLGAAAAWLFAAITDIPALPIAALGLGYVCQAWAEPLWAKALADGYKPTERARMFAAMQSSSLALAPLGALVAGLLLAFTTPTLAVAALGIIGVIAAAVPLTAAGSIKMIVSNTRGSGRSADANV